MRSHSSGAIVAIALTILSASLSASTPVESRLTRHVAALTQPELEGRASDTPGAEKARTYIKKAFSDAGLTPAGQDVWSVSVPSVKSMAVNATFEVAGSVLASGVEFSVAGFSDEVEISQRPVFAGYGLSTPEFDHDDYASVDVRGRIVVAMTGAPAPVESRVQKATPHLLSAESKAAVALSRGAVALVLINDPRSYGDDPSQRDDRLAAVQAQRALEGIAVVRLPSRVGARVVEDLAERQRLIDAGQAASPDLADTWSLEVKLDRTWGTAESVVGKLGSDDGPLIVIGAHYDGLGEQQMDGQRFTYEGADDNASGVAVLIELARELVRRRPEARVYVVSTDAEERGLLGARSVASFLREREGAGLYINMDMVGRMRDALEVYAPRSLSSRVEGRAGVSIRFQQEGDSTSDHLAFRDAGFDVIHVTTGRHADYHQVTDTVDKLDFSGMARTLGFMLGLVEEFTQ